MKKLLTIVFLTGVSQSALGMEPIKTLPANSFIFSDNFKADNCELELDLNNFQANVS